MHIILQTFDRSSYKTFPLIFDVIEDIYKDYNEQYLSSRKKYVKSEKEISKRVYLKEFESGLYTLNIHLGIEKNLKFDNPNIIFVTTVQVYEGKLYISLYINSKQYSISMNITNDLLEFLCSKITNFYNIIELYIYYDEEDVRVIQIYHQMQLKWF